MREKITLSSINKGEIDLVQINRFSYNQILNFFHLFRASPTKIAAAFSQIVRCWQQIFCNTLMLPKL
jgi:hypothetical protein